MATVTPSQHPTQSLLSVPVNTTSSVSATGTGSSSSAHDDSSQPDIASSSGVQQGELTASGSTSKKSKGKKAADPVETSKLLAAKISQLEIDRAGEKDIEAEIEREVKKANRDIANLLASVESPLSRIDVLQKKYSDLLADMRRLDREHVKSKKRAEQLQKEKDQGRAELSKTVTMREKLEKLCRELQKENKKLKEGHKQLEDSEKKKRQELNEKFDDLLEEVQDATNEKEDPEVKKFHMDLDEAFRIKFRSFIEQYEVREIHYNSLLRTKEIEVQQRMAQYENQKKRADHEEARARALSAQVATFSQTEAELRNQLNIYVEKFKQVEDTLNNSNDLFLTFRREMEDMSKKTKRLEKENNQLIHKQEVTNRNIYTMAEERTRVQEELVALRKRNASLEKLCRSMQAQGRGVGGAISGPGPASDAADVEREHEDGGTESEYDYDEDEDEADGEDSEDGAEADEVAIEMRAEPARYGLATTLPVVRPSSKNGVVNGTKH